MLRVFTSTPSRRLAFCFFFSSRRRHTRFDCDWSSDVCSSDSAFVLSQDQTLREELLQLHKRVVRGTPADLTAPHVVAPPAAGKPLGLSLVGSDPRVHQHRRLRPEVWSSSTPRAPDARRGQSWHRRLSRSANRIKAT